MAVYFDKYKAYINKVCEPGAGFLNVTAYGTNSYRDIWRD